MTTDVQALSHPGAVCHAHKHAPDLADEPDLPSSSWLFIPLLLLLQELTANYLPSVKANIVIPNVLQMVEDTGGDEVFLAWCLFIHPNNSIEAGSGRCTTLG